MSRRFLRYWVSMALLLILFALLLGAFQFGAASARSSAVAPPSRMPSVAPSNDPCSGIYVKSSRHNRRRLPRGCAMQHSPGRTP
jgi:hypothetical protein